MFPCLYGFACVKNVFDFQGYRMHAAYDLRNDLMVGYQRDMIPLCADSNLPLDMKIDVILRTVVEVVSPCCSNLKYKYISDFSRIRIVDSSKRS